MRPTRVLQVLTIMNRGGAETMIMNYYRAIDRTKIQFDFLLHRNEKGAFDDEIKDLGGIIHRMPPIKPTNYFRYKKLLSAFFKSHPEYRIVHSHLNALSSLVLAAAKQHRVPIRIAHSHLAIEPYIIKNIFYKNRDVIATIKDTIQSLIRGRVKKTATHYFACSEKAGNWLFGEKNTHKVQIINNAIDTSSFIYNRSLATRIKETMNFTNEKIIGHVGRFNEQKNHLFLIRIFKEIVTLDKNSRLLLIGDGNMKNRVEEEVKRLKIENYVLFLGIRGDIPLLLQSFDVFLFPSLYEGLPVTLIEAQASGIKIVTSDTVTQEVDISGLVTFLNLNTPEKQWAQSVLSSIPYERKNMSKKILENGYDIHRNARNLQDFYLKSTA